MSDNVFTVEQVAECYKGIAMQISALKHDNWEGTKLTRSQRDGIIDANVSFLELVPHCCINCMTQKLHIIIEHFTYNYFGTLGITPQNDKFMAAWDYAYAVNTGNLIRKIIPEYNADGYLTSR